MSGVWIARSVNLACVVALLLLGFALDSGKLAFVRVAGASMVPALYPGDLCVVTPTEAPSVRDIVLVAEPGHSSRVLHRISSLTATGVVTKGDANPVPDRDPVSGNAVLGRVVRVVPVGRFMYGWRLQESE